MLCIVAVADVCFGSWEVERWTCAGQHVRCIELQDLDLTGAWPLGAW